MFRALYLSISTQSRLSKRRKNTERKEKDNERESERGREREREHKRKKEKDSERKLTSVRDIKLMGGMKKIHLQHGGSNKIGTATKPSPYIGYL